MSRGPNGEHPYLLAKRERAAELERELAEVRADLWDHRRQAFLERAGQLHAEHPNAGLYLLAVAAAAIVGYALGMA